MKFVICFWVRDGYFFYVRLHPLSPTSPQQIAHFLVEREIEEVLTPGERFRFNHVNVNLYAQLLTRYFVCEIFKLQGS